MSVVERADGPCAVWALDSNWVNSEVRCLFKDAKRTVGAFEADLNCRRVEHFKELFQPAEPTGDPPTTDSYARDRLPFVCAMNPYRLNQRLTIQQGALLVAGDVNKSLETNLESLLSRGATKHLVRFTFEYDRGRCRDALTRLYRMNMSRATLYPGLQGFAESLVTHLLIPVTLAADPDEFRALLPELDSDRAGRDTVQD